MNEISNFSSNLPLQPGVGETTQPEVERLSPDAVSLEALQTTTPEDAPAAEEAAQEPAQVSVSDILQDPTSVAHSFMNKAKQCLEQGDTAGYFAYQDHAMTWAQTEAASRNSASA